MGDYVKIEAQTVSNALGAWDDAAGQLEGGFETKARAALDAFNAHLAAVGDDHAGHEYKKAVKPEDVAELLGPAQFGPGGVPLNGNAVTQAVADLGTNTRTAINRSLASDVMQGEEMKQPQQEL